MYGHILVFFKFIYLVMENYEEDDELDHQQPQSQQPQHQPQHQRQSSRFVVVDAESSTSKTDNKLKTNQNNENDLRNQFINACNKGDLKLVQKLIDRGYRDEDNLALSLAISSLNSKLISKLLNLKSYADPEYKINKKNVQFNSGHSNLISNLTFSSIFPTTPVAVNFHGIGSLQTIEKDWILNAALFHNPKLRFTNTESALASITRLDLSSNNLIKLPICVFQLSSLKVLNLSQNCLQTLPETDTDVYLNQSNQLYQPNNSKAKSRMAKSKSFSVNLSRKDSATASGWNLPSLEEMHLVDNELESLPMSIFELANLQILDCSNNHLRHLPSNVWFAPKLRELNLSLNLIKDLPSKLPSVTTILQQQQEDNFKNSVSVAQEMNTAVGGLNSKLSRSIPDLVFQEDQLNFDAEANLKPQTLKHLNSWSKKIELVNSVYIIEDETEKANQSKLVFLNISHNSFTSIPAILSCAAPSLTRLNMSFNCLKEMGNLKFYPSNIKHIDLSNNQIDKWFTSSTDSNDDEKILNCFLLSQPSDSSKLLGTFCQHKEHLKLENLRTLLISNNKLDELVLNCAIDDSNELEDSDQFELTELKVRNKLAFPNLSYLDISLNRLKRIPRDISYLTNLSVLNISKNRDICQLPPELGLLNKLWNLNTQDCNLDEPIRSMIESKKYKTMDIIGYLKSILEDSKPYTRLKLMLVGVQGIGKTTLLELLRQEGSTNFRNHRKPEHWARRIGNKHIDLKTPKGVSLSTVGIDVSDFMLDRKIKGKSPFGPVTFSSWDFGGQKEYYSTHQYFLSKRSLYLVVWKIIDGEKGVESIHKWLVNIAARAPNSPVLIVGTFQDQVKEYLPKNFSEDLQRMIRERFINIIDPDKVGLPRVVDSIEVSTKTKFNIKNLCNLIYDVAFDIRCPGSKERLLQQKIPASYLALEEIVNYLAAQRKAVGKDPVLKADEYKNLVLDEMHSKYGKTFRDLNELNQATSFLHENGILLHYEDAALKDLYFLDCQWLFDLLAHVVTIREINPYAKNGTMKTEDLKLLFKSTSYSFSIKSYILNLLNKFEVALTWDSRTILIPSLLPEEPAAVSYNGAQVQDDVRIPLRSRNRTMNSNFFNKKTTIGRPKRMLDSQSLSNDFEDLSVTELNSFKISSLHKPENRIYRLFLMRYFPSGFFSRLIVKLLADDIYSNVMKDYFNFPDELVQDQEFAQLLANKPPYWKCYQTYLSLVYLDQEIFKVKEVLNSVSGIARPDEFDYLQDVKFYLQQEKNWIDISIQKSSILEIYLPNQWLFVESIGKDEGESKFYTIEPNLISVTKLLAMTVDHVDLLMEDWYPSLGTRFLHTSDGKFLISRIACCKDCMHSNYNQDTLSTKSSFDSKSINSNSSTASSSSKLNNKIIQTQLKKSSIDGVYERSVVFDSRTQQLGDLSDLKDLNGFKLNKTEQQEKCDSFKIIKPKESMSVYCFMIEECILKASENKSVHCPVHKKLNLKQIAPDVMFCDLTSKLVFNPESIKRTKLLGRGSFGLVFKATVDSTPTTVSELRKPNKKTNTPIMEVAMKTLQPVEPGTGAKNSDQALYKAALDKWDRDPLQYCSKAYCTARQELNILLQLNHPNIVSLLGVCLKPLALILKLAPLGALDLILKDYRRSGLQLEFNVLQLTILQIARALEYLHQNKIIYRDLKSENVLVWEFPLLYSSSSSKTTNSNTITTVSTTDSCRVDVKLADYGISRSTLPTGTKGFAGTEGFIAPEIYIFNGQEEYNEKVDCFSFGMFIFELITLRLPFEGQDNSVKDHILEGLRPKLTQRDILYPSYVLDLMNACWSQNANERPASSSIVLIVLAPEFIHLLDCVSLVDNYAILSAGIFCRNDIYELWLGRLGRQTDLLFCDNFKWHNYKTISNLDHLTVMSICVVPDSGVWVGDSKATVHLFSVDGSYIEITNFCLDPNALTSIKSIKYVSCLDIVVILSTSGRMWLCEKESLCLIEIENQSLPFLCFSLTELDGLCQLWCGQSEGCITVITLESFQIYKKEFLSHYDCENDSSSGGVSILDRFDVFEIVSENDFVFSYLYPGTHVYQWNIHTKKIQQKLDCSKLAPCSESLMSISIEQHLNPNKIQIKSIAIMDDELYIGTTLGSLIIVEGSTLRPIVVFRPFEEEIRLIIPVDPSKLVHFSNNLNLFESSDNNSNNSRICGSNRNKKFLITIGKGFRGLLDRYLNPIHDSNMSLITHSGLYAALWAVDFQ